MAMPPAATIALDAGAWVAVQVTAGYVVHRLAPARLDSDGWLFRERAFERRGRLYSRRLKVDRWKSALPEAGALFAGGVDKRRLTGRSGPELAAYARETRRAELGHWLAMAAAPLFLLWNPWYAEVVVVVYALAVNAPCIVALRYNRIRVTRVLGRLQSRARPRD